MINRENVISLNLRQNLEFHWKFHKDRVSLSLLSDLDPVEAKTRQYDWRSCSVDCVCQRARVPRARVCPLGALTLTQTAAVRACIRVRVPARARSGHPHATHRGIVWRIAT